jgi:hypothetical protein
LTGRGCHSPFGIKSYGQQPDGGATYPLASFWAAHGFAVIQPTHLDSAMLAGVRSS